MPIKDAIMSLLSHDPKLKMTCRYSISKKIIMLNALISKINIGLLIESIPLKKGTIQNIPINVKRKLGIRFGAVPANRVIY